jgi:anti-sigma B factor antagonist
MDVSDGSVARSFPGPAGAPVQPVRAVRPAGRAGTRPDAGPADYAMWWTYLCDHLRAKVDRDVASVHVRLAGELDLASSPQALRLVVRFAGKLPEVVLDLAWVTFCDASGIRFLTEARVRLQAHGTVLTLRNPHRAVRRVLTLTGLLEVVGLPEPESRVAQGLPGSDVLAILETTVHEAMRRVHAHAANVQLFDPSTQTLRIVAQEGFGRKFLEFFEVASDDGSDFGARTLTRHPLWIGDVTKSPFLSGSPALDVLLDAGSRSIASLPIRGGSGELIAVLSAHRPAAGQWAPADRRSLDGLAHAAGRLTEVQAS